MTELSLGTGGAALGGHTGVMIFPRTPRTRVSLRQGSSPTPRWLCRALVKRVSAWRPRGQDFPV